MAVILYGYHPSVYTRIVRFALVEKNVPYSYKEVNPFDSEPDRQYLDLNPLGRVPTLIHDGFEIYETSAITRYIDEAFPGPLLQPKNVLHRARMMQIISIIDCYAYWPMVRQVFAHRVFRSREGEPIDEEQVQLGLDSSTKILDTLEGLVSSHNYLCCSVISLADIHFSPMMDYFQEAPEAKELIPKYNKLFSWWLSISSRVQFINTYPDNY